MDESNANSGFSSETTGSMGGGKSTTDTSRTGFGVTSATDSGTCPHCGHSASKTAGLEQFLGRLGITDEMINNLKTQFQNVDVDEYLNTARDYLKGGSTKATAYAKDNPGKVAAGVAALAVGAGLLIATVNRDK
jgi:hypothetical protein